jgi:hypothetical protein
MRLLLGIAVLLLLAPIAAPANAQPAAMVLWDEGVAAALHDQFAVAGCDRGAYALHRQTCLANPLNVSLERSPFDRLTPLDQLALLVDRYKDLHLNRELGPRTRLRLKSRVMTLYDHEAELRLSLSIRF